jgi:hypothetical protein
MRLRWRERALLVIGVWAFSCLDQGVDPVVPIVPGECWRLIPPMTNIDVRYIIESSGMLYLAGVDNGVCGQPCLAISVQARSAYARSFYHW